MVEALMSYIVISGFITLLLLNSGALKDYYGSPKYIYNNSIMNIIGVILCTILFFILTPWYYFIMFIYWICHVGRK